MLNAKEAYDKSTIAKNKLNIEQLEKISELIESFCNDGTYYTIVKSLSLNDSTIKYLKELGYKVKYYDYGYWGYYTISWAHKKESWLNKWIKKLKDSEN